MRQKINLLAKLVVALLIALGAGWIWGAWGRADLERKLEDVEIRSGLAEARGRVLQARVDLFQLNFGDASTNLEAAKLPLQTAIDHLDGQGLTDAVRRGRETLSRIAAAQQLAGKLDQGANTRAGEAVMALDAIRGETR